MRRWVKERKCVLESRKLLLYQQKLGHFVFLIPRSLSLSFILSCAEVWSEIYCDREYHLFTFF